MIKDVGPCDKTDTSTAKISQPADAYSGSGTGGVTGRGGSFGNTSITSVKNVEEPSTEQLV
jgi:hypothetical protein